MSKLNTVLTRRQVLGLVRRFEDAVIMNFEKGKELEEDRAEIEDYYKKMREVLLGVIPMCDSRGGDSVAR